MSERKTGRNGEREGESKRDKDGARVRVRVRARKGERGEGKLYTKAQCSVRR